MSEPKHDESFKVVDRRLFTPEGEFRKEIAEQQDREHEVGSAATKPGAAGPAANAAKPAKSPSAPAAPATESPSRLPNFEHLVRSLGQNAALLLGGYADPRTGQTVVDLEGAREVIDMLDALREKTRGNLATEEDSLLLDVLGNLKLAYMEMAKAATKQEKAPSRP